MKTKRIGISKLLRFEVFKRDDFTCQYCGATPPGVLLHVDHIVPVADGGGNEIDNLATACAPCNSGKAARSLDAIPQSLKDKADEISEREEQLRGYHNVMEARRQRIEDETWIIVDTLEGQPTESYNRRGLTGIRKFLERLPFHSVLEAAETAQSRFHGHRAFRYFCGICWKRIRGEDDGPC